MRSVIADPISKIYRETSRITRTGVLIGDYSGVVSYVPYSWVRSDVTKVDKVNGWRKPTAYKSTAILEQPLTINALRVDADAGLTYTWVDTVPLALLGVPPKLANDSSLRSVLIYRALASVKDEKINLAVSVAEIGETVSMIQKHLVNIRRAYSAARRGQWKRAYDILGISRNYKQGKRDLASGWLEMIYGWLPLLSDIYGAIKEVNRKVLVEGYTIVGRAKSVSDEPSRSVTAQFYRWGGISARIETDVTRERTQKVALWYRVDMPSLQRAAAIGVLNPASLLWELTPFSFLVDWVSTIGDWLASLDATVGLTYMGGTHTYRATLLLSDQRVSNASYTSAKMTTTPGTYSEVVMDRAVIKDSPDDRLVFTNPVSTSHAITASALLITSLKTR